MTIKPEDMAAIIDIRKQLPLDLSPLTPRMAALTTLSYFVAGIEHLVAVERKSLGDPLRCCVRNRDRFDRDVQRLLAYPARVPAIDYIWRETEQGQ